MSTPYFVHKDDLAQYQLYRKEHTAIQDKLKALTDAYLAQDPNTDRNTAYRDAYDKASDELTPQFEALSVKYAALRTHNMFSKELFNELDYVPHFLGCPLEGEFAEKMLGVAEAGIDACTKAIKGD